MKRIVHRHARWLRWSAGLVLIVALLISARALPLDLLMQRTRAWLGTWGVWSPIAFCLMYLLAALLLMPVWPFAVLAASLYGLLRGTLTVFVAALLASGIQFLIARYVARESTARVLMRYPVLSAVDDAISTGGWRIVALLRLSPVLPFGLQNYFYGLTAIAFWPYLIASGLAMLPYEFLYVYAAYLGGEGLETLSSGPRAGLGWKFWVWQSLGLMATFIATAYMIVLARRAIRRRIGALDVSQGASDEEEEDVSWPVGTLALLLLAIVALGLAVWAHLWT